MSETPFVVTKNVGFLERIKSSLAAIGTGLFLVIASIGLLYRNEGRSIQTEKSRNEAQEIVVEVPSGQPDDANNNKLVYTNGTVTSSELLDDAQFGITPMSGLVALKRKVEMYQRQEKSSSETKENMGGSQTVTTKYSYEKVWSDDYIDSSEFQQAGHDNPGMMRYESVEHYVDQASLGGFQLSPSQIASISRSKKYSYNQDMLAKTSTGIQQYATIANGALYLAQKAPTSGEDQTAIGDLRISWSLVPTGPVSLIAQQMGDAFSPYQTEAGNAVDMLVDGIVSKNVMIAQAKKSNVMLTRAIRVGGILLIIMGLNMLLSILVTISSVIPLLGWVVNAGTGLVSGLTGFVIGMLTIALAWLRFRPLLSLALIIVIILAVLGFKVYKKNDTKNS